jgi:hypothetical protein
LHRADWAARATLLLLVMELQVGVLKPA